MVVVVVVVVVVMVVNCGSYESFDHCVVVVMVGSTALPSVSVSSGTVKWSL